MMVRTQVSLPTELHRRAKARAAERGVSLAEYVRSALLEDLNAERSEARGDIEAVFGLFDSGGSDIARYKDEYVAEAARGEHHRKSGGSAQE